MPRWKQDTKLTDLARQVDWVGEVTQFAEVVGKLVKRMPDEIRACMTRYYMLQDATHLNEDGELVKDDRLFYQRTMSGRWIMRTIAGLSLDDLEWLTQLKREGKW